MAIHASSQAPTLPASSVERQGFGKLGAIASKYSDKLGGGTDKGAEATPSAFLAGRRYQYAAGATTKSRTTLQPYVEKTAPTSVWGALGNPRDTGTDWRRPALQDSINWSTLGLMVRLSFCAARHLHAIMPSLDWKAHRAMNEHLLQWRSS